MKDLETLRTEVYDKMLAAMSGKRCHYDMHIREKAYFTCEDAMRLVREAQSESLIELGQKMFNRFAHLV